MYTNTLLSLFALASTAIAAPAAPVPLSLDGSGNVVEAAPNYVATAYTTVMTEVLVTVTAGAVTSTAPATTTAPVVQSVQSPPAVQNSPASSSAAKSPAAGVFIQEKASSSHTPPPAASSTSTSSIPQLQSPPPSSQVKPSSTTFATQVTQPPNKDGLMTISIVNMQSNAVSTSYQGEITPVSGKAGSGAIAAGATAVIALPTGWHGGVALNNGPNSGDDTLIEGSFMHQDNVAFPMVDIDVSYVNGFSVPVTCSCAATKKVLTGCNKDLFALNTCTTGGGDNACKNPTRDLPFTFDIKPIEFFAPCAGAAYSFPHDDIANSNGVCQSGTINCCIGTDCPSNPATPK